MTKELNLNLVPIKDFRCSSDWPNNRFELSLSVYCDKLGVKPVLQHNILNEAVENIAQDSNETLVVAGGNFGILMTGNHNNIFGDCIPASHGLNPNDVDVFIISDNKNGNQKMHEGVLSGINNIMSDNGIMWWHRFDCNWSEPSLWGAHRYFKVKFYERGGEVRHHWPTREIEGQETLHFHHLDITEKNWLENYFRDYQPWKSNVIGSPMYFRSIICGNDSGHCVWNPYPTDDYPDKHIVNLTTTGEVFTSNIKSILQATRVALGVVQASFASEIPAEIDPETLDIMKNAVQKYSGTLSPEQRIQAEKRLKTVLFRAWSLQHRLGYKLAYSRRSDYLTEYGFPKAHVQVAKTLDSIKWGKKVIGKSCKSVLASMQ